MIKKGFGDRFANQRIDLDGSIYELCHFDDCLVVYNGGELPLLKTCSFTNCQFALDGAAGNTVQFMKDLYNGGLASVVEGTFADIRAPKEQGNAAPKP